MTVPAVSRTVKSFTRHLPLQRYAMARKMSSAAAAAATATSPQESEAGPSRVASERERKGRIPIIRTLEEMRRWRSDARDRKLEVGIVPTMGALHEGHLNLVRTSLSRHPLTIMTLFVNPMQFAPTEDLSKYPRTLERDLELLSTLLPSPSSSPSTSHSTNSTHPGEEDRKEQDHPLVIFNPSEEVMYPLRGDLQDLTRKRGVEVDVKGWGDVMEGASRPQFFKGVATVCTKLFNAVEPDHAYFGQKDIQQALFLRISPKFPFQASAHTTTTTYLRLRTSPNGKLTKTVLKDLLISHPTPENMHIIPTSRDPSTHLALSSRNAYLSSTELDVAPVLYRALSAAKSHFDTASTDNQGQVTGEDLISIATTVILDQQTRLGTPGSNLGLETGEKSEGVRLELDYVEVFDRDTFEPIRGPVAKGRKLVIAGAVWVGQTRLIDNLLLGWDM